MRGWWPKFTENNCPRMVYSLCHPIWLESKIWGHKFSATAPFKEISLNLNKNHISSTLAKPSSHQMRWDEMNLGALTVLFNYIYSSRQGSTFLWNPIAYAIISPPRKVQKKSALYWVWVCGSVAVAAAPEWVILCNIRRRSQKLNDHFTMNVSFVVKRWRMVCCGLVWYLSRLHWTGAESEAIAKMKTV